MTLEQTKAAATGQAIGSHEKPSLNVWAPGAVLVAWPVLLWSASVSPVPHQGCACMASHKLQNMRKCAQGITQNNHVGAISQSFHDCLHAYDKERGAGWDLSWVWHLHNCVWGGGGGGKGEGMSSLLVQAGATHYQQPNTAHKWTMHEAYSQAKSLEP